MMEEKIPPRRVVLRGALAAGCSLWMPITFSADDTKQGTPPPAAPASKKAPKASVQYQIQPKGDQKCSLCLHFIAASKTCKLVEGPINPEGWCTLWAKKA